MMLSIMCARCTSKRLRSSGNTGDRAASRTRLTQAKATSPRPASRRNPEESPPADVEFCRALGFSMAHLWTAREAFLTAKSNAGRSSAARERSAAAQPAGSMSNSTRRCASRNAASTSAGVSARAKMKPRYDAPSGRGTSGLPIVALMVTSSRKGSPSRRGRCWPAATRSVSPTSTIAAEERTSTSWCRRWHGSALRWRARRPASSATSSFPFEREVAGRRSAGGLDVERQPCVRPAQRRLDERRGLRAREDEAEVRRPFRERHERPADRGADCDVLDARDAAGSRETADPAEHTGARDRDHHDTGGARLTPERADVPAEGVHQDDFLERQTGAEAEGARAQAADGAGGDLDEPGAAVVDAKLGMHGTLAQSEGAGGGGGRLRDLLLDARRQAGRRDVDRLLEERTIQRVRLVEQGEHLEAGGEQDPFQGDLDAGHELFDQHEAAGVAAMLLDVRLAQQDGDAPEGRDELFLVVGAYDAPAGGQERRLEHHGIDLLPGGGTGIVFEGHQTEARRRDVRVVEDAAQHVLA